MQTSTILVQGNARSKVAAKRFKRFKSKPAINGITKGDMLRLAKKGGVGRLSVLVYQETKDSILQFLKQIVRSSLIYMHACKRSTCRPMDVFMAMKHHGRS